jgi:hypothetical protein
MSEKPNDSHPRQRSINAPGELVLELPLIPEYSSPRIWKDGRHVASVHWVGNSDECEALARTLAAAKVMQDTLLEISGILTGHRRPTVAELNRIQKICSAAVTRAAKPESHSLILGANDQEEPRRQ